ncbi:hypothetical protein FBU30_005501 [Linnemannia zychae]|nr:hypothetical protein FBU30_005501 [Linnemannia zychae]
MSLHPALKIPEILLIVGSFMTRPTLVVSLRVNHYFYQTLAQILYNELHLSPDTGKQPLSTTVQSYFHHIRRLSAGLLISADYIALNFRQLTSISLGGEPPYLCRCSSDIYNVVGATQVGTNKDIMDALETLVRKNPNLRQWNLRKPNFFVEKSLWMTIAHGYQQSQQDATVTVNPNVDSMGPLLDLFDIEYTIIVEFLDIKGLSVLSQPDFLAQCTEVRTINWRSTTETPINVYTSETLTGKLREKIVSVSPNGPMPTSGDVRRLIQPGTWMHLRSLTISGRRHDEFVHVGAILSVISDEGFAHILETISAQQLQSLRCIGTTFGPLGLQALKRHADSLKHLEILQAPSFTSSLIQEALEEFPKLLSLKVGRLSVKYIEKGQLWACQNLTGLLIQFDMEKENDISELEEEKRRYQLVFNRLSTLTCLEDLELQYPSRIISEIVRLKFQVSHGLSTLATLRSLKSINLGCSNDDLGLEDASWICAHCSTLSMLQGEFTFDKERYEMLEGCFSQHNVPFVSKYHGPYDEYSS